MAAKTLSVGKTCSAVIALGAVSMLGTSVADAAPARSFQTADAQAAASNEVGAVVDRLGDSAGGYFFDDNGKLVVNVLDDAAARQAARAGYVTKRVAHSTRALTETKNSLDALRNVPQTAWGLDPANDQVVVTILSSASESTERRVSAAAAKFGDKVRVEHRQGRNELYIRGGDAISNSRGRCSNGFNVKRGSTNYLLTAGHCTNLGGTWRGGDMSGGRVVASDCPGADSGLITNRNGTAPGQVNTGQRITSAARPARGQQITKSGSTTGVTYGTVTSVDQSVNFDVGRLNHMTGTTVRSDHGDSGGPGYTGSAGQGTLSGGDSRTTYFYPLYRELQSYGVTLA